MTTRYGVPHLMTDEQRAAAEAIAREERLPLRWTDENGTTWERDEMEREDDPRASLAMLVWAFLVGLFIVAACAAIAWMAFSGYALALPVNIAQADAWGRM